MRAMAVVTMTSLADPQVPGPAARAAAPPCRTHGKLDSVTDSERRALRSIGTTAREVAVRTGALLADLFTLPGVRIFQGVRPAEGVPPVPHVVNAGRRLVFVESVAWPPGRYTTTAAGRVHCNGVYIGQSVRVLIAAVRQWRDSLPEGHGVSAVIVVHVTADGELALPAPAGLNVSWARAGDAVRAIRGQLCHQAEPASLAAVAALIAATAGDGTARGDR
jgi:hypothetical protein